MTLTQRESDHLQDLIKQENLCIEKYGKAAGEACDPQLKDLLNALGDNEREHRDTLNQLSCGCVPDVSGGGHRAQTIMPTASAVEDSAGRQCDKHLCADLLQTEKHASSMFDNSVFEFSDVGARTALNHMQKEEQEHGQKLYSYMQQNGMSS